MYHHSSCVLYPFNFFIFAIRNYLKLQQVRTNILADGNKSLNSQINYVTISRIKCLDCFYPWITQILCGYEAHLLLLAHPDYFRDSSAVSLSRVWLERVIVCNSFFFLGSFLFDIPVGYFIEDTAPYWPYFKLIRQEIDIGHILDKQLKLGIYEKPSDKCQELAY